MRSHSKRRQSLEALEQKGKISPEGKQVKGSEE
jgi:hypothetical protein